MAPRKKNTEAKILRYPDSAMQSAITAVREGRFKIREAARHFGVPHPTLINKLKGRVPEVRKMGPVTYFTATEENLLAKYIIASAKKGIPIKRKTLIETVKKILDDDNRVTPFKNNRPGRKWIELFLNRHPEISERHAEGISTARANVSANDIKGWHQSLEEHLKEENALDILEDPKRIFNSDESGFHTCPDSGKILGPAGMKNFYQIKSGKEKEQLTVMVTISAAGNVVPPMIVYPLVRISKEISTNVPENWGIGKSSKGWMTGPLYYEYIANIFDPWLKMNNIQKPVLLLIDGHRSHLTLQVSQYCAENKIIAYALFPNSTHITQPADVSVFRCLKSGWKNTVTEYKHITGNRQITRSGFAPLLAKVFDEKVTPEVVANGFKRCGIYPFDVNALDFSRCMDHDSRKTAPVSIATCTAGSSPTCMTNVETLLLFQSFMRQGRLQQFKCSDEEWKGDETATELFYVWKKFSQHCFSEAQNIRSPIKNVNYSAESQRAITPSPSLLMSMSKIFKAKSATNMHNTPNLPVESETSTRCSTPVSTTLDLPEFHTSTKSITPIHTVPELLSETASRYCTLVETPALPGDLELPDRFCTPVSKSQKYPEYHISDAQFSKSPLSNRFAPAFEHNTVAADENFSSPSSNLLLLTKKQKQLSPAFGKHIIWPSTSPLKKTKKERLPFATTSKRWQEYWTEKENEKELKTIQIESRKLKREEKKRSAFNASKKRKKKVIKSDTSESEEEKKSEKRSDLNAPKRRQKRVIKSDTSESDEEKMEQINFSKTDDVKNETITENEGGLMVGDFVIFVYEGAHFVGKIVSLCEEGALIKSMHQSLNNWKWPDKEDVILYSLGDIKEKIKEPQFLHEKRGIYSVPEYEKYKEFI